MVKAVVFDFDGVIADSEPLHEVAEKMIFRQLDVEPDGDITGLRFEDILRNISEKNGLTLDIERLIERKFQIMIDIAKVGIEPIENSIELVNSLGGIKLAIVSNSRRNWVEFVLNKFGIYKKFNAIVTAEDVKRGKPGAEPYLLASKRLGINPEDCLAVEDSSPGVKSAKAAGMRCVAFQSPNTKNQDLSSADCSIKDLLEIKKMVL